MMLFISIESLPVYSSTIRSLKRQIYYQSNLRCYYKKVDDDNTIVNIETTTNDDSMTKSYFLLNLVAVIYGTQHPIIKISMNELSSTSLVNFWRFLLSALLFSPAFINMIIGGEKNKEDNIAFGNNDIYLAGIELGVYTFLGFAFQAIGLETTTASRSAFLLYLNVKFVPFLALLLFKRSIHPLSWLSATFALIGTSLLSTDGGSFNTGDLWCICAAIASAMFIIRLDGFSKIYNAAQLNALSFLSVAFFCGIWVLGDMLYSSNLDNIASTVLTPFIENPWPLIYLGIITTGLCNYIQTIGQRKIPAEKAAIIYSLDPLYGAFFSWLWLNEQMGYQGIVGGLLILTGVYVASKVPQTK
jgi:drug/metabolite transporter (DMT)-like permease